MIRVFLFTVVSLFWTLRIQAQPDSLRYIPNFDFVEGIYRNYLEFKNNDPSIREKGLVSENFDIQIDLGNWLKPRKIFYQDQEGNLVRVRREETWGYCTNRVVFINFRNNFHRVVVIGSMIHFTVTSNISNSAKTEKTTKYIAAIMDYHTGKLWKYNLESFLNLLKQDPEMYAEFETIKSKRKKKKQMFIYLLRFNERHPIYFKVP